MSHQITSSQYQLTEWLYLTTKSYTDPFNDIELDVILTHADGQSWRIPAHWSGGNEWQVQSAPLKKNVFDDRFF